MKVKYDPNKHHRRSIRLKGYDYAQAGRYFVTFCVKDREHFFGEIIENEMHLNDAGIMIERWFLELENKFPKIQCHEYVVMPNHFHAIIQIADVRGEPTCSPTISDKQNDMNSPETPDLRRGEPTCSPTISDKQNNMNLPETSDLRRGEPMCSPEMSDEQNNIDSSKMSDATIFPIIDYNHVEQGRHIGLPQQLSQQSSQQSSQRSSQQLSQQSSQQSPQQSPQQPLQSKPILGEHKDSPLWEVVQWFKTMTTNEYIRGVKTLGWERFNGKLWQRNYYEHIIRNDESCERIATYIINNPANWKNDSLR